MGWGNQSVGQKGKGWNDSENLLWRLVEENLQVLFSFTIKSNHVYRHGISPTRFFDWFFSNVELIVHETYKFDAMFDRQM